MISFISEQGPVNESTQARSFENSEQYVAAVYDHDVQGKALCLSWWWDSNKHFHTRHTDVDSDPWL